MITWFFFIELHNDIPIIIHFISVFDVLNGVWEINRLIVEKDRKRTRERERKKERVRERDELVYRLLITWLRLDVFNLI